MNKFEVVLLLSPEITSKLRNNLCKEFAKLITDNSGKVINTELRYQDEFVRHKILDLIGDLYLLGYSLKGRVVANMTSHGYNQALVQKLHVALTT